MRKRVGALGGRTDPPLGDDLKDAGLGQAGDVTVDGAGGHVGQLDGELLGGKRAITRGKPLTMRSRTGCKTRSALAIPGA